MTGTGSNWTTGEQRIWSCPSPTGSPTNTGWVWDGTPGVFVDNGDCATTCSAPAPTSTAITRAASNENQTLGCPAGQTGAITQTRTRTESGTRTTTWSCPGPTSSTSDSWSGSYSYGAWATASNTCTPAAPAVCWRKGPNTVIPYSGFDGNATHTNISNIARANAISGLSFSAPNTLWNNGVNKALSYSRMTSMPNPDTCSEGEYFLSEKSGDNAISGNMMETWICTASTAGNSACL